jgi:hypothetical protein
MARIDSNMYFLEDMHEDEELGTVISGARWAAIDEHRFTPIYEWLKEGEYEPRLNGNNLDGIIKSKQFVNEVERCGRIFDLARQLLLWRLGDLVAKKFSVLCSRFCKMEEKPVAQLMIVVRLVYSEPSSETDGERRMRELLIQAVSEHFWDMATEEPSNMKHGLARFPQFYVAVLDRMARMIERKLGLKVSDMDDEDSKAVSVEG